MLSEILLCRVHIPDSVAEGILVGLVRVEPSSDNEAQLVFKGPGAGRGTKLGGKRPRAEESGLLIDTGGEKEGIL